MRLALVATAALLPLLAVSACGGEADGDPAAAESAHRPSVCTADATAVALPDAFPDRWPMPPATVVTAVEDRDGGVIVSAVTATGLKDVLAFLNGDVADAGFAVTSGETEDHDAEANWSGGGYRGRWAIRDSAACDGETELQVFAARR